MPDHLTGDQIDEMPEELETVMASLTWPVKSTDYKFLRSSCAPLIHELRVQLRQQAAEIERLRGLVREAFREGFGDAWGAFGAIIGHGDKHRRHLDESQRAMVAAKLSNLSAGDNQHTDEVPPIGGTSQEEPVAPVSHFGDARGEFGAIIGHGDSVVVYDGMRFTAVHTGNA